MQRKKRLKWGRDIYIVAELDFKFMQHMLNEDPCQDMVILLMVMARLPVTTRGIPCHACTLSYLFAVNIGIEASMWITANYATL